MFEVQTHLMRIYELTRAIAEAVSNRTENFAAELNRQLDAEKGRKGLVMRALQRHRKEHGC